MACGKTEGTCMIVGPGGTVTGGGEEMGCLAERGELGAELLLLDRGEYSRREGCCWIITGPPGAGIYVTRSGVCSDDDGDVRGGGMKISSSSRGAGGSYTPVGGR